MYKAAHPVRCVVVPSGLSRGRDAPACFICRAHTAGRVSAPQSYSQSPCGLQPAQEAQAATPPEEAAPMPPPQRPKLQLKAASGSEVRPMPAADCASNHFMHAANKEDALVQACQCTWALTVNSQVVADCLEILECLILQAGKKAPTARIAAGPDGSRGFAAGRGRGMPAAPPGIAPPPAPPGNPPSVPKTACRILVFAACFVSVAECRCMFT